MKFKLLGRSGLRVSELCLGAMTFGNTRGWGASREEAKAVFDAFVDAGGNFIDTANVYQNGESESLLGAFIQPDRHRHVVATKYTLGGHPDDPNSRGNSRKAMVQALESSLRALGTDYIDLYWMHAWDGITSDEEVMRALDDMVRAGKILYIGMSDTPAWVISRSQAIAELRGWTQLAAVQMQLNLLDRTSEQEYLPLAEDLGLSLTTWGALGSGLLSGKYKPGVAPASDTGRLGTPGMDGGRLNDRNFAVVDAVATVAAEIGASQPQVALAWVRSRSDKIIPILGARVVDQLRDNLKCLNIMLTPEQIARLEGAAPFHVGFPWSFYRFGPIGPLLHGPTVSRLDVPFRGGVRPPTPKN